MKSGTIIAMGGGSIGEKTPVETTAIDQEAIKLTGKKHPAVLFVPTASRDRPGYVDAFRRHFESLGAKVDVLYLYEQKSSGSAIKRQIQSADILYVGGGNPLRMLMRWRALGVDKLMVNAWKQGTLMMGQSAGAICWFQFGLTDCWHLDHNPDTSQIIHGLGLIPGVCNPHYNVDSWRAPRLKLLLETRNLVGIAIDNGAALVVEGEKFRIVRSKKESNVYRTQWITGEYSEKKLDTGSIFDLQ